MAPARKRGAKGAKSKSELSLGDLVLAKVKGFPAWPAKISRPEDWERAPDPKKYFVQFFGTEEIAFVAPVDIQAFTSESKKKLIARCQGKTVKYFAQAVKEIGEAFEELQHNKSSAVRDDTDRASGGCEAPSNDGVEDDAMEVDPKDGTDGDETSKETETRSLNEHSSGLERCSQKGRVKDCLHPGTSMACETDGGFLKATSSKKNKISNNDAPALENVKLSPKQDNSLCLKDEVRDDSQGGDAICTGDPDVVTAAGSSDACKNEALGDAEGDSQNGDSSLKSPGSTKISDSGKRLIANGHKAERNSSGPKKIARGTHEVRKSSGPLQIDSRNCLDSTKSEDVEDERPVRISGGSSMKIVSPGLEPKTGSANKRKKLVKDKKDNEVEVEAHKEALQGSSREQGKSEFSSGKKMDRIRLARNDTDASHPAKRSKHEEASDLSKKSLQKTRIGDPCSLNGEKMKDKPEVKRSTSCSKTESSAPKVRKPSSHPDDIDAPPQNKRCRRASEVTSDTISHSDSKLQKVSVVATKSDILSSTKTKPPPMQLHSKRRAVRIFDEDDEEEPKTPVHGGSSFKVDTSSVSDRLKNTSVAKDGDGPNQLSLKEYTVKESGDVRADSPKECLTPACPSESASPNPVRLLGKKLEYETDAHISNSPGKVDFEKASSEDTKRTPISPKASPSPDGNHKPVSGPLKGSRPSKLSGISHSPGKVVFEKALSEDTRRTPISPKASPPPDGNHKPVSGPLKVSSKPSKLSGAGNQKKTHTGSSKSSVVVSDGLNHSQNQAAVQRSKQSSSLERSKSTPMPNVQDSVSSHATENTLVVNSSLSGERLEASTDDKVSSFVDSKMSDSAVSMKNLIAVARAKKKEAHSQSSSRGMAVYHLPFASEVTGRSPGHVSAVQPLLYGSVSGLPTDIQEHSLASPSHGRRISMNSRSEAEEYGEKRVSSEHRAGGSLSGGTEAAVARDAFEGMLETLSRTKESISRATRLAIECAKYGIANEVVELLIRKLEGEPNLHRKVDLFFLVDSITQCSRTQKGIAEASYIPTVQAALPRLIGAAAPPGSAARENRKQCLKVLRLWVERKVLPESVLRRYMDEIGASNDDSSAGFFHRRPSRAERAVDDPIREMEGMLVDEYGSNATFQLPGLLTSHVFEDDEEEDIPSTSCKDVSGGSLEPVNVTGEPEMSTPSDKRHRILEDVDGELEMEDVSGHPKDERFLFADGTFAPEEIVAAASSSEEMVGSPPLPCDSPPPSPPLPSSPIPPPSPPPLPRSPSSPPPPPPSPLPRALPQLSVPPQASMVQQQLHTSQLLVASSPKSAYQQQGSQALPTSGSTGHLEVAVRKDVYPQQSPSFALAGIPSSSEGSGYSSSRQLDYGSQELFVNSQSSQSNQQFQAGNGSFSQRAFHPTPVPQTAPNHYLYPNSAGQQQHPQNPYPRPYSLVNHSEGSRRYGTDEQWRISSGELNPDNQRALWMNGGRAPSSGPPLSQEGYFRPPLEMMASANNVGFQAPAPQTLPAGAPIPGHGPPQTLPSVSDVSAHSYWRPS